MLNQLIKDVLICRCIHKTFGIKVRGNLVKALDRSQNVLSNPENGDVKMEQGSLIFGKIRAEPAPYNTLDLFEFNEFTKINEPCLNIVLETGQSSYKDFTVFNEVKSIGVMLNKERYHICTIPKDGNKNS